MSALSKTAVSLRFFGDDLNPDEVTQLLGKEPDKAERRGDVRSRGYTVRRGMWSVRAGDCTPGDLDGQIAEILAGMTNDLAVWQRLTSVYQADVFCGLFLEQKNEGIFVSPETLQLLGERGIKIQLDIYAYDGEDKAYQIQSVVNQAGRPIEVVGSAASGTRTPSSDIDYIVPPSSLQHYEGLENQLPGIDPNHDIIPGVGNPYVGPVIRFEPQ